MILEASLDAVVANGASVLVDPESPRAAQSDLVQAAPNQSLNLLLVRRVVVLRDLLRVEFPQAILVAEDGPGVSHVGHPQLTAV